MTATSSADRDRRLKILAVSHLSGLSGAERSLLTAISYFINHDCEVVCALPAAGPLKDALSAAGAKVYILPLQWWTTTDAFQVQRLTKEANNLAQIIRSERSDIVYSNTSVISSGALAAAYAGKPHVWHVREFLFRPCIIGKDAQTAFLRNMSNHVIFNSAAVRADICGGQTWPHSSVVYNYVPPMRQYDFRHQSPSTTATVDVILELAPGASPSIISKLSPSCKQYVGKVIVLTDRELSAAEKSQLVSFAKREEVSVNFVEPAGLYPLSLTAILGRHQIACDVVLARSDVETNTGWLTLLKAAADVDPTIATVSALPISAIPLGNSLSKSFLETTDIDLLSKYVRSLSPDAVVDSSAEPSPCVYVKRDALAKFSRPDELRCRTLADAAEAIMTRARDASTRMVVAPSVIIRSSGIQCGTSHNPMAPAHRRPVSGRSKIFPSAVADQPAELQDYCSDLPHILRPFVYHPDLADRAKILVLAPIVQHKGQIDAIRAIALLRDRGLAAHLMLAGPHNPATAYYGSAEQAIESLGLKDCVHIIPEIKRPESLLRVSDILLVSSQAEPWGRTAVEAMMLSKPVVGADAGGLREIVKDGETGYLYPAGDIQQLACALEKLLVDPARRDQFGQAGYVRALELSSLDSYGSAILNAVKTSAGQDSPASGIADYLMLLNQYTMTNAHWATVGFRWLHSHMRIRRRLRDLLSGHGD